MIGTLPVATDTVAAVDNVDDAVEVIVTEEAAVAVASAEVATVEVDAAEVDAAAVSETVVEILLHCNCLLVLLFDKTNLLPFTFFYPCLSFYAYSCFYFFCVCIMAFHSSLIV